MISLLSIVSAVEAVFTAAEEVETEFNVLKPYVTQLMQAAETAYGTSQIGGQTKFNSVMAATKAIAAQIGLTWSNGLEAAIAAFINVAKAAFNAFAGVVSTVAPSTAAAVSSATSAVSSAASTASAALASTVASPTVTPA
jgi:hypothetical protein